MKLLLCITLLLVSFGLATGQTGTDAVVELRKLESQIRTAENVIAVDERVLAELRIKYSDEYPEIRKLKERIKIANDSLVTLYLRRKEIMTLIRS